MVKNKQKQVEKLESTSNLKKKEGKIQLGKSDEQGQKVDRGQEE